MKRENQLITTQDLVDIALELSGMSILPADSAVYVEGSDIRKVLFGIDIAGAELLLARDLGCDAVIAHHPAGGSATLRFPEVLARQLEFLVANGVPENEAREAVQPLITRATMAAHARNHDHVPSIARAIGMPFMNMHLPLDELGRQMLVSAIDNHLATIEGEPSVQDAIDGLAVMPEFKDAMTPIMVPAGSVKSALGRYVVVHGAGTNGGANIARTYFSNGIDTVLYIHCGGDDVMRLQQEGRGNLIVTGHISSDMVGINPYVREIEARGVEVVRISGL